MFGCIINCWIRTERMDWMEGKRVSPLYRALKWVVWLVFPKMKVYGMEHLPAGEAIIVANHAQMNGPIASELYLPGNRYTWCAGQMMHWKEVPSYAYQDFWSQKPKRSRWLFKIAAYLITPIAVLVFNNANTIGVYHDARLLSTFRTTLQKLAEGAKIVIFPEHDQKYNNIIYDFQNRFIDLAQMHYSKTGRELAFVPMYVAPRLKGMYLGQPVRYCAGADLAEERVRICDQMMRDITDMARALPRHTVIPYRNIRKRDYPQNI